MQIPDYRKRPVNYYSVVDTNYNKSIECDAIRVKI